MFICSVEEKALGFIRKIPENGKGTETEAHHNDYNY